LIPIPLALCFSAISDSFRPGPCRPTRSYAAERFSSSAGDPAITQMGDVEGVLPNRYRGDAFLQPGARRSELFARLRGSRSAVAGAEKMPGSGRCG